jgi:hypothetical protein
MIRSYSGYYKKIYLRSSYEYALARYLDEMQMEWRYEIKTYNLGDVKYKPDFFLIENGEIVKILEVKSDFKKEIDKANEKIALMKKLYGLECELITNDKLVEMYKNSSNSLTKIKNEWISTNRKNTVANMKGKKNPHFGLKHSQKTLEIIGMKTKERWEKNDDTKKRMLEGLRKSGQSQKGKLKSVRVEIQCEKCNKKIVKTEKSKQRYCTQKCAGNNNIDLATKKFLENMNLRNIEIRKTIISWSVNNKQQVIECKFNQITPTFKNLLEELDTLYNIKDYRTITKAFLGKNSSRKEFLLELKKNLLKNEKICRPESE